MEYSPGLRGVVAGETAISTVGKEGTSLRYRGYDAIELTKNNTYEDVASLIIKDSLNGSPLRPPRTDFVSLCKTEHSSAEVLIAVTVRGGGIRNE